MLIPATDLVLDGANRRDPIAQPHERGERIEQTGEQRELEDNDRHVRVIRDMPQMLPDQVGSHVLARSHEGRGGQARCLSAPLFWA